MYYSADSVVHGEQHGIYPTEFLNTLSFSGIPPHELHLQEGCPIILLRNMTSGLANGTRLNVIQLMQHVIKAKVANKSCKGLTSVHSTAKHHTFRHKTNAFHSAPSPVPCAPYICHDHQ
jgi:hypothetical protein